MTILGRLNRLALAAANRAIARPLGALALAREIRRRAGEYGMAESDVRQMLAFGRGSTRGDMRDVHGRDEAGGGMGRDEFERRMMEGVASAEDFRPVMSYCPDGDVIEVQLECTNYVGDPLMPGLVVYRERESGRAVGFLVDGVEMVKARRLIRRPVPRP